MPSPPSDHYDTLGIPSTASAAEIRAAYRRLALEIHPDRPGGDAARFRDLGRAYAVLSDAGRRADYDARRRVTTRGSGGVGGSGGEHDSADDVVEVDLSSLGVVDAALLSVFGKLGVAIRAAPPPAVLDAARSGSVPDAATQRLSWVNYGGDGDDDDEEDPLLRPLPTSTSTSTSSAASNSSSLPPPPPPLAVAGSVARGQADWYRVTVPEGKAGGGGKAGSCCRPRPLSYAIAAHSRAGSKLKLLLFEPGEKGRGNGVWELAASADSVPFVSSSSSSSTTTTTSKGGSTTTSSNSNSNSNSSNNGQLALLVASESFQTLELRPPGTMASLAAARGEGPSSSSFSASSASASASSAADAAACGGAFRRLDGLSAREPASPAAPGTELLIAVVGANTFRKSSYSIRAVLLPERRRSEGGGGGSSSDDDDGDDDDDDDEESKKKSAKKKNTSPAASAAEASAALLRSTEEALLASRRELSELEARHRAARLALEGVAAEAAAASARAEALLRSRDEAYARVLGISSCCSSATPLSFSVRSNSAGGEL